MVLRQRRHAELRPGGGFGETALPSGGARGKVGTVGLSKDPTPTIQTASLPIADFESWLLRLPRCLKCQIAPARSDASTLLMGYLNSPTVTTSPGE